MSQVHCLHDNVQGFENNLLSEFMEYFKILCLSWSGISSKNVVHCRNELWGIAECFFFCGSKLHVWYDLLSTMNVMNMVSEDGLVV